MFELALWAPALLTFGVFCMLFQGRQAKCPAWIRALASLLCGVLTVRYMIWRFSSTLPLHQNFFQTVWAKVFLFTELSTLTSSLLVYFFMSRTINRSDEATAHQNSANHDLPADVFIATYNESRDILERTMVGALAIDHTDLRVWLLGRWQSCLGP